MDSDYLRWLKINHPDSIPPDRHMLVIPPKPPMDTIDDPSLTDLFSFVQPSSPLAIAEPSDSPFLCSHTPMAVSAESPPTLTSTAHTPTAMSAESHPTLTSTAHTPTAMSAESHPTLTSTTHTPAAVKSNSPPTLTSTAHTPSTESVNSPTLIKIPATTPRSMPSSTGASYC